MAYQTSVVSSTEEALSVGFGLGLHCRRRQESAILLLVASTLVGFRGAGS